MKYQDLKAMINLMAKDLSKLTKVPVEDLIEDYINTATNRHEQSFVSFLIEQEEI